MMPSKIEAPMWEHEYGKAMEHLSRMLGKLIKTRGETVERIGRG